MNMKKVAVLPLAVVAMGLTSCNKSWPTITKDEAKDTINAIIKEVKSDFENLPNVLDASAKFKISLKAKGHTLSGNEDLKMKVDLNNNYNYIYQYNNQYDPDESSMPLDPGTTSKYEEYDIYKDGKAYSLDKISMSGYYAKCEEEAYKTKAKESYKSSFIEYTEAIYQEFKKADDIDGLVTYWDQLNEKYKTTGGYLTYKFASNDKTKRISVTLDYKTVIEKTEYNPEIVEESKSEMRFENSYPIYAKSVVTIKTGEFEDSPASEVISENECTASYPEKINQDNINLDNYIITAGK